MAANVSGEYRVFKYYEGLCSSGDFPKEIAKVLSLGVKSEAIRDVDGNIIEEPFVLRNKNWDIVYPAPDAALNLDLDNLTTEEYYAKIMNQVSKISDTVILRTTTTERNIENAEFDDLTVDSDTNKTSLTMYLEIYHPTYIADPEQYPLDCERRGIIPKLITKEMYKETYRSIMPVEQYIYQDTNVCTKDTRTDVSIGSVELRYDTCDSYVSKINNILGVGSFSIPTTDGTSTSCHINSADLTRIKQNDATLYELILNTLDGGEGIEAKDYALLDSITVEVMLENSVYTMIFEGTKTLTVYSIQAGKMYQVSYDPTQRLIPELYLDGIYTPIDSDLYHTDGKKIYFDDNFSFEASTQGVLVIRYEYEFASDSTVTDRITLLNNHYVLMRMFDHINEDQTGPMENVYNSGGEITQINSHVSPWSKLSWYQDFEEVMLDTLDGDIPVNNIHDGTIWVPLETPGLNADTKIRYWINTNNDRFSLIVMGNPSMDYMRDRHLVSGCYCGRIDSFDNSINDTAGNFALFTSSSTEPCNTTLEAEQMMQDMPNYMLTDKEVEDETYNQANFQSFITGCPYHTPCAESQTYYIQLTDKTYFNRKAWPKYVILNNSGKPVTPLVSAYKRNFITQDGKSDLLQLTIDPQYAKYDDTYTLYVSFAYYQEKYIITSGVTRDLFGNVIDVDKVKDYGVNTSDGVTSVSMFHTRSKAYYQKHHMLFATTEEYMSKVMYGKSSYTGEYYADRIKITHGNDGPRGTLSDLLVIDSSSLYALDELVINKDFEKDPDQYEETFVYFPITAPFSPLSDSPNSRYGFAIKKEEIEPRYEDEDKILRIASNELGTIAANWWPVDKDIFPRDKTSNGCDVYWEIMPNSFWFETEDNKTNYCPIQLAVVNTSEYFGDQGDDVKPITNLKSFTISKGDKISDGTHSYVKLANFEVNEEDEKIYWGVTSTPEDELVFNPNAQIRTIMFDGAMDNPQSFEYNIDGVPFKGIIGTELPEGDFELIDASPDKYLVLYSVKEVVVPEEEGVAERTLYVITSYATRPLCNEGATSKNDLLQYPCSINVLSVGGKGNYCVGGKLVQYQNVIVDYESEFKLAIVPADGYDFKSAQICREVVIQNEDGTTKYEDELIEEINKTNVSDGKYTEDGISINGNNYAGIILPNVNQNIKIKVTFEPHDSDADIGI